MIQKNKKVLIISMRAGFGHLRAGDALLEYAENLKQIKASHIDIIEIYPALKWFAKFYEYAIKKAPIIWKIFYTVTDNSFVSGILKFFSILNPVFRYKIKKYILEKNPDIILFTNMAPIAILLSTCRNFIKNKVIGVVLTDYHGHYYYKFSKIDYYFVGHKQVKEDLERKGIKSDKIIVTGIPVNPRFYIKQNIDELKIKYKINNDLPVVLLISAFKTNKYQLKEILNKLLNLEPKINIIFISNGNLEFYNFIESKFLNQKRLFLVNWTNMIEEYMKISDVVISKAGGLTVSECLALSRKMIIINSIPGQEEHNVKFLEKYNLGKKAKDLNGILDILPEMIYSAKSYAKEQELIPKENPSEKIFKYLDFEIKNT